jgi:hypothetical protein
MPTWKWFVRARFIPRGSDDFNRPIWNVWPQEAQDAQAAFPKGGKVDGGSLRGNRVAGVGPL